MVSPTPDSTAPGTRSPPPRLPWSLAPGAALSRFAPSRSPDPDRGGNSFPLTSSSKMQKISDFDR